MVMESNRLTDQERDIGTDQYGFVRQAGPEQVSDYGSVLRRRAIKWRKLLQGSRVERSLK
ncbi:hypothetical protein chiPu_0022878, partial [Chiloscyllium punctatum]|nr:hypothetical protein [Chiloscyllium punctatum]